MGSLGFTQITNDLLHSLGWKSFVEDDKPYFLYNGYVLVYDINFNNWGCNGYEDTFNYWEDFLDFYEYREGKAFIPEEPTPPNNQFLLDTE